MSIRRAHGVVAGRSAVRRGRMEKEEEVINSSSSIIYASLLAAHHAFF